MRSPDLLYAPRPRIVANTLVTATHALAALWPLLGLACLYGCWFAAWLALGHRPLETQDDPKDVVGFGYFVCLVFMLFLFPAGGFFALASTLLRLVYVKKWWSVPLWVGLLGALWIGAVVLMRNDPWRVAVWFWD